MTNSATSHKVEIGLARKGQYDRDVSPSLWTTLSSVSAGVDDFDSATTGEALRLIYSPDAPKHPTLQKFIEANHADR
jgi:hypothetical protein